MRFWSSTKDPKSSLPNLKDIKLKVPQFKMPANLNMKTLMGMVQQVMKSPGRAPSGSGTHMKYPYTISAKLAQFPYKFYYNNNWIFRYYIFGVVACLPIFAYFHTMSNTKENKAQWKQIRKHEREEAKHKFDY